MLCEVSKLSGKLPELTFRVIKFINFSHYGEGVIIIIIIFFLSREIRYVGHQNYQENYDHVEPLVFE